MIKQIDTEARLYKLTLPNRHKNLIIQKLKTTLELREGFTLVEALVSTALFILISGIVFVAFNTVNSVGFVNTDFVDLQQQTRQAIEGMSREIRQNQAADGVNLTNPDGTGCNQGLILLTNNISYYLNPNDNTQIIRECPTGSGATWTIANKISSLCFTNPTSQTVGIKVTATASTRGRTLTPFSLSEEIAMRN